MLQSQKEVIAASAEATIYEEAADIEEGSINELDCGTHSVRTQRTKEYIQAHALDRHQQQATDIVIPQSSLENTEPLQDEGEDVGISSFQPSYGMEELRIKHEIMDFTQLSKHLRIPPLELPWLICHIQLT